MTRMQSLIAVISAHFSKYFDFNGKKIPRNAPEAPLGIPEDIHVWAGNNKLDESITMANRPYLPPDHDHTFPPFSRPTKTSEAPAMLLQQSDHEVIAEDNDDEEPWGELQEGISSKLKEQLIGQPLAAEMIGRIMLGTELLPQSPNGPRAVMLFVGPDAVGKRLAAKLLSEILTRYSFLSLDLSQIGHHNQTSTLIGDDPSFQNAAPGHMTTFVAKRPKTVVLFENIERCHPSVLARLQSLFTEGQIADLYGIDAYGKADKDSNRPINFRETVLIFSTTAAEETYNNANFQAQMIKRPTHAEGMLLSALADLKSIYAFDDAKKQFSREMINHWRGGRTILFNSLSLEALSLIAYRGLVKRSKSLAERWMVPLVGFDSKTWVQPLLLSYAPELTSSTAADILPEQFILDVAMKLQPHNPQKAKPVILGITDAASQQWEQILQRLTDPRAGGDVLTAVRRRNYKAEISWKLDTNREYWTYLIDNVVISQVQHAQDLDGDGSIRVELPKVGFADIAGHVLIKARLMEVVQLLRASHVANNHNLIPRGMLLYGQPGTGKTMLARALAYEAELPFINTTGTELLDVGLIKKLFNRARRYAPAVIFIDEIDGLGRRDQHPHHTPAINQLLTELDGFDGSNHGALFVIAATNNPNVIDPALRRPGRLDLHLEVPALDPPARGFFVDKILQLAVSEELDRESLIRISAGMSGAKLAQLQRELQLVQLRNQGAEITRMQLLETFNALVFGERSTRELGREFLENTAIHEAGHAVVQAIVNPEHRINQISIIPRANTAGFVHNDAESMVHHRFTRKEVIDMLCVMLAGRNAQERLLPGSADDGSADDLQRATVIAVEAVGRWGLSDSYGLLSLSEKHPPALHSAVAPALTQAAHELLHEANQQCKRIIHEQWERIVKLQQRLLHEEFILDDQW